ncbi:hypothetical protein GLAREA_03909 [Glarea lozoyensis ATCC 20868]|uniref:Tat pathway signal sequence n=1 Tax=Glarea lozoyensis (strain ATCC 20868 / MF5171) TaxID=1116229 RepID=S3CX68_GLAL2|nr:uncharacterized protein GLAREA_03909 [Glarea lozoyensis ATCC 20868]EPE30942.1 hypothetical protein GLAREA_03909 [Glarea lozoyensis ATCC 20868]
METACESLLEKDEGLDRCSREHKRRYPEVSLRRIAILFTIAQISLIITYTAVFLLLKERDSRDDNSTGDLRMSPARDAIRYEQRYFEKQGHVTSPFSGEPRPALEEAWHNLLSGMNIRVSEEYLTPYGAKSLPLAGGGYAAQLGMYHELHCLKKVRHWLYKDHYHHNATKEELARQENHIHHCLEWLRIVALCRGDTVLTTFEWGERNNLETEYPIPRQCVDSDHLLSWSQHNAVDLSSPGLLSRPGD